MMITFEEKIKTLIDRYLSGEDCGICCSFNVIAFYSMLNVADAIRYACDYGKVKVGDKFYEDPHYEKLCRDALEAAKGSLLKMAGKFENLGSFMEIYRLLRSVTEDISGVNRMFYYDTSVRIAAAVGKGSEDLLPEAVFYQRGAELGAIQLGILTHDKIDNKNPYIPYQQFIRISQQFERLKPYQIEDFLCIFHRELDIART